MESSFLAAGLLHPIALGILAFIVFASVAIGGSASPSPNELSRKRVLGGFIGVVAASLFCAAASAYVSPEEAKRFGVSAENYTSALQREFIVLATITVYLSVVGCAVIGLPAILALAKRGHATVPAVIGLSVLISLAFVCFLAFVSSAAPAHVARDMPLLVGAHAFLALAFAVGARLPWRRRSQNEA